MLICSALILGHILMLSNLKLSKTSLIVIAVTALIALFAASGELQSSYQKYKVHQALSDYQALPENVIGDERCDVFDSLISYSSRYDRDVFNAYYPEYQKLGCE